MYVSMNIFYDRTYLVVKDIINNPIWRIILFLFLNAQERAIFAKEFLNANCIISKAGLMLKYTVD